MDHRSRINYNKSGNSGRFTGTCASTSLRQRAVDLKILKEVNDLWRKIYPYLAAKVMEDYGCLLDFRDPSECSFVAVQSLTSSHSTTFQLRRSE